MLAVTPAADWDARINACAVMIMAMTLRLTDAETRALLWRAEHEGRPMQESCQAGHPRNVEAHSPAELLDWALDEGLPRYAEVLERLPR